MKRTLIVDAIHPSHFPDQVSVATAGLGPLSQFSHWKHQPNQVMVSLHARKNAFGEAELLKRGLLPGDSLDLLGATPLTRPSVEEGDFSELLGLLQGSRSADISGWLTVGPTAFIDRHWNRFMEQQSELMSLLHQHNINVLPIDMPLALRWTLPNDREVCISYKSHRLIQFQGDLDHEGVVPGSFRMQFGDGANYSDLSDLLCMAAYPILIERGEALTQMDTLLDPDHLTAYQDVKSYQDRQHSRFTLDLSYAIMKNSFHPSDSSEQKDALILEAATLIHCHLLGWHELESSYSPMGQALAVGLHARQLKQELEASVTVPKKYIKAKASI